MNEKENGSHVFPSSPMARNSKHSNLHRVIHDLLTHDLECPWHDYRPFETGSLDHNFPKNITYYGL